jgi:minor extracellular serine protease Vpr
MYYSVHVRGISGHRVLVTPAAIRIARGASRTYTVRITGPGSREVDSGWITWRGANGISVRIPVVVSD